MSLWLTKFRPAAFGEEGATGLPFIDEFERAAKSMTCYSLEPKRNRCADDPIYEDAQTEAAYWGYCAGQCNANKEQNK